MVIYIDVIDVTVLQYMFTVQYRHETLFYFDMKFMQNVSFMKVINNTLHPSAAADNLKSSCTHRTVECLE